MAEIRVRRTGGGAALLAVLALGACGEDGSFLGGGPKAGGEASVTASGSMEEREVEAPEIFEVTEAGLWDGRPTFGGVWVAHPDAQSPERVTIVNTATGVSVKGALFRRERERPGPRIEVSSDAAAELGLLAGQPQELRVVALKTEAVPVGPSPEEIAAASAAAQGVEDIATTSLDAPSGAAPSPVAPASDPGAPLPPVDLGAAAAAIEAAEPAAPAPARSANAAPITSAPPAARPAIALERAYVQVGFFSEEANARAADAQLRDAGIVPTLLRRGDRYRIIVGPARDADERASILTAVQALGFTDAYYVTE